MMCDMHKPKGRLEGDGEVVDIVLIYCAREEGHQGERSHQKKKKHYQGSEDSPREV